MILSILFDRLYVLRNQLVHRGATWNSDVNRDQVRDGPSPQGCPLPIPIDLIWTEFVYLSSVAGHAVRTSPRQISLKRSIQRLRELESTAPNRPAHRDLNFRLRNTQTTIAAATPALRIASKGR